MKTALICYIIYSAGTNGNWSEKLWHEVAHCNGWTHPVQAELVGAAYRPPVRYLHLGPNVVAEFVSPQTAMSECKRRIGRATYACAVW